MGGIVGSIFSILILVFIGVVLVRCSDNSQFEYNVESMKPFYHEGKEWQCKLTEKQVEIDNLSKRIELLRGQ